MNYKKAFEKIVKRNYPEVFLWILEETEERHHHVVTQQNFVGNSKNPLDKRLYFAAYFLSYIQVMEARKFDYETIKSDCTAISYEYVRPKNTVQRISKKLPLLLLKSGIGKIFIDLLNKKINVKGHQNGFKANIITDKKETYGLGYGIDILECGICKMFDNYKAEKYISILCEVDRITSGFAGLELIRKGTIASGSKKCDFRFKTVK